jgi:hypothetical protein
MHQRRRDCCCSIIAPASKSTKGEGRALARASDLEHSVYVIREERMLGG